MFALNIHIINAWDQVGGRTIFLSCGKSEDSGYFWVYNLL